MTTRGPTFWIVLLAVAAAATGLWLEHRQLRGGSQEDIAEVGDRSPDATFIDIDGKTHRLSDWHGRRVLLNFWASWCAPCRREMPLLNQADGRHRAGGAVVIGVAEDTRDAVRAYLREAPVGYPVLLVDADAPGGSLSLGNTLRVLPYSVLIGEDGRILRRKTGTFTAAELDDWLAP